MQTTCTFLLNVLRSFFFYKNVQTKSRNCVTKHLYPFTSFFQFFLPCITWQWKGSVHKGTYSIRNLLLWASKWGITHSQSYKTKLNRQHEYINHKQDLSEHTRREFVIWPYVITVSYSESLYAKTFQLGMCTPRPRIQFYKTRLNENRGKVEKNFASNFTLLTDTIGLWKNINKPPSVIVIDCVWLFGSFVIWVFEQFWCVHIVEQNEWRLNKI